MSTHLLLDSIGAAYKDREGLEGHSGQEELATQALHELVLGLPIGARILEIGFNAGHSSWTMLASRADVSVVSLDSCVHPYVRPAKIAIDTAFPRRHTLIVGDSTETLPRIWGQFDLYLIDGGHDLRCVTADIANCLALARKECDLICVDDVTLDVPEAELRKWCIHPTAVWRQNIREGLIRQVVHRDLTALGRSGRGWAVGVAV